jgi:hypothetical protein
VTLPILLGTERPFPGYTIAGMPEQEPTEPQERPESEPPIDERRNSGCFGLPTMLAIAVVIAAGTAANSLIAVVYAVVGLIVLYLAIGLAMTIAKRD